MIASDLESWAHKVLPQAANLWAERARTKAKMPEIASAIVVGDVLNEGSGRFRIEIRNEHPAAAAYEFGSGIHRTRGGKETYPIKPKNANRLKFIWNPAFPNLLFGSPKFAGRKDDTYYMNYVDHPGVAPEPHMKPALDEVRGQMREIIGKTFAVEVVHRSIREMWNAK